MMPFMKQEPHLLRDALLIMPQKRHERRRGRRLGDAEVRLPLISISMIRTPIASI
jgi:hypothetical protein